MTIIQRPSLNFNDRKGQEPSIILLHYTGMENEEAALDRLCDVEAEVSAHYTIGRQGAIHQHVDEEKRAWHAGKGCWKECSDINSHSIGIELVNRGHEFGYEDFSEEQISVLIDLCAGIMQRHSIQYVLAHSDVAPARKEDPGEKFPWSVLAGQGIGVWPAVIDYEALGVMSALEYIGYDIDDPKAALIAFQRHYVPEVFSAGEQGLETELTKRRLQGLMDIS